MNELKNKLKESDNVELQDMAFLLNDATKDIYKTISCLSTKSIEDLFDISPDLVSLSVVFGKLNKLSRAEEISKIYDDLLLAATTESKYIPIPEWASEYE